MRFATIALCLRLLGGIATAHAAPPVQLPNDARLDPVRPRLAAIVTRAETEGLPAEVIVSKVREGLAKGVDPQRIEAAAGRLASGLAEARETIVRQRPGGIPSATLMRAYAEARLAGVEPAAASPLLRAPAPEADSARAVEVLTDLSLRGYPPGRAAALLENLLARDAPAVVRVPAALELIRQEQALSPAESVDALARGVARSGSLKAAAAHAAAEDRRRGAAGKGPARAGQEGASPGSSGFVPPGLLKKETGAKNASGRGPKAGAPAGRTRP